VVAGDGRIGYAPDNGYVELLGPLLPLLGLDRLAFDRCLNAGSLNVNVGRPFVAAYAGEFNFPLAIRKSNQKISKQAAVMF
jgi:hypothetical protein